MQRKLLPGEVANECLFEYAKPSFASFNCELLMNRNVVNTSSMRFIVEVGEYLRDAAYVRRSGTSVISLP